MPQLRCLTGRLLIVSALGLASSCASKPEHLATQFPPAVDVKVEPRPIAPLEILTSEQALENYQNARDAWGERGWAAVARICRFYRGLGMPVECPAPNVSELDQRLD